MFDQILLSSVDSTRNRNRAYAVTITSAPGNSDVFIVRQSWGRGDYFKSQKRTYFEDLEEVYRYALSLLLRRAKHGYEVNAVSEWFPLSAIPEGLSTSKAVIQTSLFMGNIAA